jgi:hypothetical protein
MLKSTLTAFHAVKHLCSGFEVPALWPLRDYTLEQRVNSKRKLRVVCRAPIEEAVTGDFLIREYQAAPLITI